MSDVDLDSLFHVDGQAYCVRAVTEQVVVGVKVGVIGEPERASDMRCIRRDELPALRRQLEIL